MSLKVKSGGVCALTVVPAAGAVSCGPLQLLSVTLPAASALMKAARFSSLVTPVPASVVAQSTMYSSAAASAGGLLLEQAQRTSESAQAILFTVCSEG